MKLLAITTYLLLIISIAGDIDYERFNKFADHREESMADINSFKENVYKIGETRYTKDSLTSSQDFPHYTINDGMSWNMNKSTTWIVGFLPGNNAFCKVRNLLAFVR